MAVVSGCVSRQVAILRDICQVVYMVKLFLIMVSTVFLTQEEFIEIKNVTINNIKDLDVKIPLKNLCAITGVSGSGKSSLILQTLLPVAKELLNRARKVKKVDGVEIEGLEKLDKVIYLDQSPIGRTPRSKLSSASI